jgi:hypothetical protein
VAGPSNIIVDDPPPERGFVPAAKRFISIQTLRDFGAGLVGNIEAVGAAVKKDLDASYVGAALTGAMLPPLSWDAPLKIFPNFKNTDRAITQIVRAGLIAPLEGIKNGEQGLELIVSGLIHSDKQKITAGQEIVGEAAFKLIVDAVMLVGPRFLKRTMLPKFKTSNPKNVPSPPVIEAHPVVKSANPNTARPNAPAPIPFFRTSNTPIRPPIPTEGTTPIYGTLPNGQMFFPSQNTILPLPLRKHDWQKVPLELIGGGNGSRPTKIAHLPNLVPTPLHFSQPTPPNTPPTSIQPSQKKEDVSPTLPHYVYQKTGHTVTRGTRIFPISKIRSIEISDLLIRIKKAEETGSLVLPGGGIIEDKNYTSGRSPKGSLSRHKYYLNDVDRRAVIEYFDSNDISQYSFVPHDYYSLRRLMNENRKIPTHIALEAFKAIIVDNPNDIQTYRSPGGRNGSGGGRPAAHIPSNLVDNFFARCHEIEQRIAKRKSGKK